MSQLPAMRLREHPLMSYRGCSIWPPDWVSGAGPKNEKIACGEVGRLKEVLYDPNRRGRLLLITEHKGAEFIGCLIFDDSAFCERIAKHLSDHYGMAIEAIGSSELAPL